VYFGYAQMWVLTSVPVGFAIVMATFVALCLVYAVGASKGKHAAERYLVWVGRLFVVAAAADLVVATASGQLTAFVTAFGWAPLVEMSALALMCVGSMWFMGTRYVADKRDDESPAIDSEG
jgi:hypothetical protein